MTLLICVCVEVKRKRIPLLYFRLYPKMRGTRNTGHLPVISGGMGSGSGSLLMTTSRLCMVMFCGEPSLRTMTGRCGRRWSRKLLPGILAEYQCSGIELTCTKQSHYLNKI